MVRILLFCHHGQRSFLVHWFPIFFFPLHLSLVMWRFSVKIVNKHKKWWFFSTTYIVLTCKENAKAYMVSWEHVLGMCFYSNLAVRGVHLAWSHLTFSNVFREELLACLLFNPTELLFHHLLPHLRIFFIGGEFSYLSRFGTSSPVWQQDERECKEKWWQIRSSRFMMARSQSFSQILHFNSSPKNQFKCTISYHQCSSLSTLTIQKLEKNVFFSTTIWEKRICLQPLAR